MKHPQTSATDRMPRLGLCCQFIEQPIRFRTTTAAALKRMPREDQLERLAGICRENADALLKALYFCNAHQIGSFRIASSILPIKTHPEIGYKTEDLPGAKAIIERFQKCGKFAEEHTIRTGFHPDQFVVLNSPDPTIVNRSIADIESQAEIAEWTHADTINIHGGGAYGDKSAALKRLQLTIDRLSPRARSRLTLENDDKIFTPDDLLPVCRSAEIPLVYDVHHHRCNRDDLNTVQATDEARSTWNRPPLFHLSSPRDGWSGARPEPHHDYIDPEDFPEEWMDESLTVEIEAKAKELAVLRLRDQLLKASRR